MEIQMWLLVIMAAVTMLVNLYMIIRAAVIRGIEKSKETKELQKICNKNEQYREKLKLFIDVHQQLGGDKLTLEEIKKLVPIVKDINVAWKDVTHE